MKNLFLTVLLLAATVFSAGAQITTSSLRGRVTDADGTPLQGATVIAIHTPSATTYGTTADRNGYFLLSGIRAGSHYSIEFSFVGYTTQTVDDVTARLGESTEVNASLRDDMTIESITVAADADNGFDASRTGVAENFSRSKIENLPSVARSIYEVARLSPQVTVVRSGGISIAGANNRYNSFSVDGVAANDTYGLTSSGTNGGLASSNPIQLDALEQMQISVAQFDVRQSGFTGGSINAVTKSGTNTFAGTAYTYYNDRNFYGRRTSEGYSRLPQQSTQIYGATLGGAIVRDRLFFFVGAEYDLDRTPSQYYPSSSQYISEQTARQIAERYAALTGYDGGGYTRQTPERSAVSVIARIDWNISSAHHFSLRYNALSGNKDETASSNSAYYFNGAGSVTKSRTQSLSMQLNSQLSPTLHNQLNAGWQRVGDRRDTERKLPFVGITRIDDNTPYAAYIGTDPYSGVNDMTQNSITISDNITLQAGNHTLTAGLYGEWYRVDNLYMSNAFGTYYYDTLQDFLTDNSSSYFYNYFTSAPSTVINTMQTALYAQDEWRIGERLMLLYGIRMDIPIIMTSAPLNEQFNSASSFASTYGVATGVRPKTHVMWSPRIGFRWYADQARSWLVRGGVGIFAGRAPFVWIKNCYSNSGTTQSGYSLYGNQTPAFGQTPDTSTAGVSNPEINIIDPKFRYPSVLRGSLSVDKTMGDGWQFSVEALVSKTFNNAFITNLVAANDGKQLYAVSASAATPQNTTVYYNSASKSENSAVYYLTNTSRGYSYSVSASLRKQFRCGLNLYAAYTFGHSYSVNDALATSLKSLWANNYAIESNSPEMSFSTFDVPHKVSVAVSYAKRYAHGLLGTNISLVYQGFSGQRYSLVYYKNGIDVNGDSYKGNSLMYIPTREELQQMTFADDTSRSSFDDYISADSYLRSHRGQYSERNALSTPFEHHVDLHVAQDFYFGHTTSRHLQISVDVINIGNMFCSDWGKSYNISNLRLSPIEVTALTTDTAGNRTPTYRYVGSTLPVDNILSRWHLQIGARIVF